MADLVIPMLAQASDADALAQLLDDFNREFHSPTPGPQVIARRLRVLLESVTTFAYVSADALANRLGVALVTLRPNVWYEGPVALLDELYVVPGRRSEGIGSALLKAVESEVVRRGGALVEIDVDGIDVDARRFYERHGYSCVEPGEPEPMYRYYRELTPLS